jgi:hypothetical protein
VAKNYLLLIFALFLSSCGERSVEVNYNLSVPIQVEVFSQSFFSTMDGEYEQTGTATAITFINEYSQDGDKLHLNRIFASDASKKKKKKSYPSELALRTPKLEFSAKGSEITNIKGYENFDSVVVAKIHIPDRWKKQINEMANQTDLERIEKQRWKITHLLLGNIPLKSNITELLVSQGRLSEIPFVIKIDSVITKDIKEINGKKCLEYAVYLQEEEPFPYFIWEQHVSSVKSGMPFKSYKPKNANYENRHEVALNLENGIPCYEREIKFGVHGMQNPETGDSVTFDSRISHERFYIFLSK